MLYMWNMDKKYIRWNFVVLIVMIGMLLVSVVPNAQAVNTNEKMYSDVPSGSVYYNDICWAMKNDIIRGYKGKFNPDGKVTIEQFCTMLSRSIPEDSQDIDDLGVESDSMIYHLRRAIHHEWTDTGAEIELYKDSSIGVDSAWRYALTATGTQIYSTRLSGSENEAGSEGLNAAKQLGLVDENANDSGMITRAQAVSIIHKAKMNTKSLPELPIVTEMKNVVYNLPQQQFNEFYENMQMVPKAIRKDFVLHGWKISFDIDRIEKYSKQHDIYGISGMTVFSEKVIYLALASSLLHEMGHYYQERLMSSAIDTNVYEKFDVIRNKEKWSNTLYVRGRQNSGAEFFADAFQRYVKCGIVRADPTGKDEKNSLESQKYFDDCALRGWI
ncbi:S-layer homology domain-containing protein [Agathobaculum butyriciproducens]|nr:S-layer homology domain-containing protein [Agathobaculum butyriciproducens]RGC58873.1 S-layer homology domain-containing protein [Agathobaculum butyriciproducens]